MKREALSSVVRTPRRAIQDSGRLVRDRDAASAVEFALIAPLFIGLLVGIAQVVIVFFAKAELQELAQTMARVVMTAQAATMSQSQFATALCNDSPGLFTCAGLMVNLQPAASISSISTTTPTLTYNSSGAVTNTWTYNAGGSGSIMVLQLMYQLPVIGGPLFSFATQSNGALLIISTVVFKNEP